MQPLQQDPWYFARPELAKRQLDTFQITGAQAMALYAERRMGKTSFLRYDVMPEALKRNLLPIYIDLWETRGDSLAALVNALKRAHQDLENPKKGRLRAFLDTPIASAGAFGINLSFGDQPLREPPDNPYLQIRHYLEATIESAKRPVLLLMDEIQAAALDRDGIKFVSSVRSALQQTKGSAYAIFSGSSESGLTQVFRDANAPLYNFANHLIFPRLGEDFVDFLRERYASSTQQELDRSLLLKAYKDLGERPQPIKDVLASMMLHADHDLEAAVARYRLMEAPIMEAQCQAIVDSLNELEREVVLAILNKMPPTGKATRAAMAEKLGREKVEPNSVAHALKALIKKEVLTQWQDSTYRISNREFWWWLKQDPDRLYQELTQKDTFELGLSMS